MPEGAKIAVVIFAAGGSSRMGKPKQLLPIAGVPLLQKVVNTVVQFASRGREPTSFGGELSSSGGELSSSGAELSSSGAELLSSGSESASSGAELSSSGVSVFVVLGANSEEIERKIDFAQCRVLLNENWKAGMSSSIILALTHIQNNEPEATGVLLVMGDQPWVTDSVLAEIVAKFERTGAPLVVSLYSAKGSDEKIPGPPAIFAKALFSELLQLEGDAGARKVVLAHAESMETVDFPLGAIDIDTETDYASVLAAL